MDGMRPADRLGRRLREPEVADLALLDQLAHRPHCVFDGRVRVHPMLVVQVDHVGHHASQGRLAGAVHVLGAAVDADPAAVGSALVAELRRQHHLVASSEKCTAEQLLVRERAVHVGGVEEGDPELDCPMDRGDRLGVVARTVELAHPHAAEALCRDDETIAECSCSHRCGLPAADGG
jgi:hypothetical protein